jgi:UDP-3-O-[3-hydroxymyristoyl] glucosamine N-acyltransferase
LRLDEIVARLGGELQGDGSVVVSQVGTLLSAAGAGKIAFLANPKYREQLQTTQASAVIVPPQQPTIQRCRDRSPNSYAYYARVVALLNPARKRRPGSASRRGGAFACRHRSLLARTSWSAKMCASAKTSRCIPAVSLVTGVRSATIPCFTRMSSSTRLRDRQRAIIHAGAVIGSDGFGFAKEGERWIKIPQIGRVVIGDDVEIGANTSIDRGALDDTVIGDGVKLDNQIQVAHNVSIGDHTRRWLAVSVLPAARGSAVAAPSVVPA